MSLGLGDAFKRALKHLWMKRIDFSKGSEKKGSVGWVLLVHIRRVQRVG